MSTKNPTSSTVLDTHSIALRILNSTMSTWDFELQGNRLISTFGVNGDYIFTIEETLDSQVPTTCSYNGVTTKSERGITDLSYEFIGAVNTQTYREIAEEQGISESQAQRVLKSDLEDFSVQREKAIMHYMKKIESHQITSFALLPTEYDYTNLQ